jgi:mono/diheme cytochrome c family protein
MKNQILQPPVENYQPLLLLGTLLALLLVLVMSIYWLGDSRRLDVSWQALQTGRLKQGQEIFSSQCAGCHGMQGEGGIGLKLNDPALLKNTPEDIFFSIVRSGVPQTQMPAWSVDYGGPLTDEDIQVVVTYIYSWKQ